MNKRRLIFFAIFGAYHLIAFIFTLSPSLLFKYGLSYLSWFKYGTLFGFLLILTDFIWWWRESKAAEESEEASRLENNTLKAKVYDLQESSKAKTVINPKD